jgi:hypothetical protein
MGVYHVGALEFVNKPDALTYATSTHQSVRWNFNEDIFSNMDWHIPIETPLLELYRQRAQQLRDTYDYVSLFFSGGVDSTNALQSFINNSIPLDEIVMFRPLRMVNQANTTNISDTNIYSEIEFAAVPYLKKYVKDHKIKIRFIEMDIALEEFFQDPKLYEHFTTLPQYTARQVAKIAMSLTDKTWRGLYDRGVTVAHVTAADKPFIFCQEGVYHATFFDDSVHAMNFATNKFTGDYGHLIHRQIHENFYSTASLPQIVIKQCQMVKKHIQDHDAFDDFFLHGPHTRAEDLSMNPIIYPQHVMEIRSMFTVKKSPRGLKQGPDVWFFQQMGYDVVGKFNDLLASTQHSLDTRFLRTHNPDIGPVVLNGYSSGRYEF